MEFLQRALPKGKCVEISTKKGKQGLKKTGLPKAQPMRVLDKKARLYCFNFIIFMKTFKLKFFM